MKTLEKRFEIIEITAKGILKLFAQKGIDFTFEKSSHDNDIFIYRCKIKLSDTENLIFKKSFSIEKERAFYNKTRVKPILWDKYYETIMKSKAIKISYQFLIQNNYI